MNVNRNIVNTFDLKTKDDLKYEGRLLFYDMLDFKGNAIMLSGVTGTKIKSEILGSYYRVWWTITSGGRNFGYSQQTAIVEMNAATGETYLEDIDKKILGSSGHALKLKGDNPNSSKLNVILVEEENKCFEKLQKVIQERWSQIDYSFYPPSLEKDWVYLLRHSDEVTKILDKYNIGISLFFFDPLLYTPWSEIESVAKRRIKKYYQIGTEFLIFTFTSDWFTGRGEWHALPNHTNSLNWNKGEFLSVKRCDQFFGNSLWQSFLLRPGKLNERMEMMVKLYKRRLQKWFRYVLPMPFEPKPGQMYHIFACSNYEAGVNITRQFYTKFTGNIPFTPDNRAAYKKFLEKHPEKKMKGSARSDEWKILWNVIRNHHDGICDIFCKELIEKQPNMELRGNALKWLESKDYLEKKSPLSKVWNSPPQLYKINWRVIKETFGITPSKELVPLKSKITDNQISE